MRNLKKILALVLALVMSLSLMATASAAETTSATGDANAYATAAKVLEGLKVLEGYPDGQMHYEDSFTRAQAAAVFYRIDTKDVTNTNKDLYTNAPFSDIGADHWARGYIAYCYDNKIVKGMGDGSFGDKSPLTGYQVLVMALRELGYGQNNEFDGDNYQIKTASTATQIGMLKGVTPIDQNRLGEPATRGLMAQIVFNMLLQETVRYNALHQNYEPDGKGTLGYQKFGLEEVEGVVVANEYAGILRNATGVGVNPTSVGKTVLRDATTGDVYEIEYSTGLDDLGMTRVAYTVPDAPRSNYKCLAIGDPETDTVKYDDGEELTTSQFSGKLGNIDTDAERYLNFGENGDDDLTSIKVTYQFRSITKRYSARTAAEAETMFIEEFHLDPDTVPAPAVAGVAVNHVGSGVYDVTYVPATTDRIIIVGGTPAGSNQSVNDGRGHVFSIVNYTDPLNRGLGALPYYRVEIEPSKVYTAFDDEVVYSIFAKASTTAFSGILAQLVVTGHVFRGTQTTDDYSNAHSYEEFIASSVKRSPEHVNETIDRNRLGWWLKVIDNDGDGYTDWVFQTRYTVAKVSAVNADTGALTLDTTDWLTDPDDIVSGYANKDTDWVGHSDMVNNKGRNISAVNYAGDAIEAGDVVYYASIDGKNYAWLCDVVEGKVESINRSAKTVTLGDGNVYKESAVHEHSISTDILSFVTNMSGTVNMKLYMDKYGNMAAFSQNITGNFRLLTNGWSNTQKNGVEYAVTAWNSTDQKFEQFDVTEGGSLFIRGNYSNNSWNNIRHFAPLNCNGTTASDTDGTDSIHTIVAYLEDDGANARLVPVDTVYDVQRQNGREIRMIDMGTTIPSSGVSNTGTIYATGALTGKPYNTPASIGTTRVRALTDTVYLYVYHSQELINNYNDDGLYVHQVVGYADGAGWLGAANADYIEDVYVVGTRAEDASATGNREYYTANIVVVELKPGFIPTTHKDNEQVFIYNFPATVSWNTIEEVDVIRASGANEKMLIDLTRSRTYTEADDVADNVVATRFTPGLYWLHRTPDTDTKGYYAIEKMSHAAINDAGIYAVGEVRASDFNVNTGVGYVDVYDWYCNSADPATMINGYFPTRNAAMWHNELLATHQTVRRGNLVGDYKDNSNAKYWNLTYDGSGRTSNGAVTEGSFATTLSQWHNFGSTSERNFNRVLIRYSGTNIVYAVSFDHLVAGTLNENYAQQVWRSILKDGYKKAENIILGTFYGVEFGVKPNGDIYVGTPGVENTATTATIALTYAQAKDAITGLNYTDTYYKAGSYASTANSGNSATVPVGKTGVGDYTVTYTVGGKTYIYTLRVAAARGNKDLNSAPITDVDTNATIISTVTAPSSAGILSDGSGVNGVIVVDASWHSSIQEFVNAVEKAHKSGLLSPTSSLGGAKIQWAFVDSTGTIPKEDWSHRDIDGSATNKIDVYAVVFAEDGTYNVYTSALSAPAVIVATEGEVTLDGGGTIDIVDAGDSYMIEALSVTRPVVELPDGRVIPMVEGRGRTQSNEGGAKYWHLELSKKELENIVNDTEENGKSNVIVVRAQRENETASGKTNLDKEKAAAKAAVIAAANAAIADLKKDLAAAEAAEDTAAVAKINASIAAIEAVITAVNAADNTIDAAEDEDEVAANKAAYVARIDKAVKDAGVEYAVTWTKSDQFSAMTVTLEDETTALDDGDKVPAGTTLIITATLKDAGCTDVKLTVNDVAQPAGTSGAADNSMKWAYTTGTEATVIAVTAKWPTVTISNDNIKKANVGGDNTTLKNMQSEITKSTSNGKTTVTIATVETGMRLHKNEAATPKYGAWVGFQIALAEADAATWTQVKYTWAGTDSPGFVRTENLPDDEKGVAFYYDAANKPAGNKDTVTVQFKKVVGEGTDAVDILSEEIVYEVDLTGAKPMDHTLHLYEGAARTYTKDWWSEHGIDVTVENGNIKVVINETKLAAEAKKDTTSFPTDKSSDVVNYDNGTAYICIPLGVNLVYGANGAMWTKDTPSVNSGFDNVYTTTNGKVAVSYARVAKYDSTSQKWELVDNNNTAVAAGTNTGKTWTYTLNFTSDWESNLEGKGGTPVTGAPTAEWTLTCSRNNTPVVEE